MKTLTKLVVLLSLSLAACGGDPPPPTVSITPITVGSICDQIDVTGCAVEQRCNPQGFAAMYPNGEAQCEAALKNSCCGTHGTCGDEVLVTQEEITACDDDFNAEACSQVPTNFPASCGALPVDW